MDFRSSDYGDIVQSILALGGDGHRPMALAPAGTTSREAHERITSLGAKSLPASAVSGLFLYFSCLDEAHSIAQDLNTSDGSFWHGIMHRQEPDAENSGYWFQQVGKHPLFPALASEARLLGYPTEAKWNPFAFIDYCEAARRKPGSAEEALAMRVQLVEWQLLFDRCARSGKIVS